MARVSRVSKQAISNQATPIFKAGIYLRLSDEDKTDIEQNSIGNQNKICEDYILRQANIELTKTYIDNGYTGTNFNRDGFKMLINDIETGKINCIIVKDLSRFGRNFIGVSEYLEVIFIQKNIRFIAVTDNYDNFNKDSNHGIILPIKNIINEYYSKETSRKIRAAINSLKSKGKFIPSLSSMPYGYIKDTSNNTYIVDEETRGIILSMFKMRADGRAFNYIATKLNKDETPSPGKLRFIRGYTKDTRAENAVWIRNTVKKILSDPVYLGHRVYGKTRKDPFTRKKERAQKKDWEIIENTHPAIISQALFDSVQVVNKIELEKNANKTKRDNVIFDCRPLLKDKMYCGECGSKLSGQKFVQRIGSKSPNFIYYECSNFLRTNRMNCSKHYIRAGEALDKIKRALKLQIKLVSEMEQTLSEFKVTRKLGTDNLTTELKRIQKKKAENEKYRLRILQDYMDKLLDKEEYLYMKNKYEKEYFVLNDRENEAQSSNELLESKIELANKVVQTLINFSDEFEITRELIECLVDKIYIYSTGEINIKLTYKSIFNSISKVAKITGGEMDNVAI